MRPKTKIQKQVFEYSNELRYQPFNDEVENTLTLKQEKWIFDNLLEHKGYATKHKAFCLDCGESFPRKLVRNMKAHCPNCKRDIKIELTRQRTDYQSAYAAYVMVYKDFQVLRCFKVTSNYKKGEACSFHITEVLQHWISPDNKKFEIVGYLPPNGWNDNWGGWWEIRNYKGIGGEMLPKYRFYPHKYLPGSRFKKSLYRIGIGISKDRYEFSELVNTIPFSSKAETLFKSSQKQLFKFFRDYPKRVVSRWGSIRICFRNKYHISDPRLWFDYLDLLERFGKDLRNAKFVCPDDLHEAHQYYSDKRQRILEEEALEKKLAKMKEEEEVYKKKKAKYIGLSFKKGNMEVSFINSVEQLYRESKSMHHCAYTNDYHKQDNTLMFSVRVDGKLKATGAVNINRKKVSELRGQNNWQKEHNTPENKAIGKKATEILQDNMIAILRGNKPKKKAVKKRELAMAS